MVKKVTKSDFTKAAEFVIDETRRREQTQSRRDLERKIKEIDRQLEMEPDISHKINEQGKVLKGHEWMPEMELPLQAQTLETLTADARRMTFPGSGPWMAAHALVDDDYLERVEISGLIAGDQNDVPSVINQDNVDQMCAGVQLHWQKQYNFRKSADQVNAEAFKYGVATGRVRLATKQQFRHQAQGTTRDDRRFPVLVPRSIKDTLLDDSPYAALHEGHVIGPSNIFRKKMRLVDLMEAAAKGSNDPDREDGGWMPKNLKGIEADKNGFVNVVEFEGDMLIPRKTTDALFSPNSIVTVVEGGKSGVVRWRNNQLSRSSYIQWPYHCEDVTDPYATSPLMKGAPVQKACVDMLNRMIMVAQIQAQPPVGYDKDDQNFAGRGGPPIHPGASWATVGDVKIYDVGDLASMLQIYISLLQQYADVTGVNAPRLGAQTVSHTTAFAKDVEQQRGTLRTVDYVNSSLEGPWGEYLSIAWELGRPTMRNENVYIPSYNGFVTVSAKQLPEDVMFEAIGAGGPSEEAAKDQKRQNAVNIVLQLDQLRAQYKQLGVEPSVDYDKLIEQIMRSGGWTDVDELLNTANATVQPGSGGAEGLAGGAALNAAALLGAQ